MLPHGPSPACLTREAERMAWRLIRVYYHSALEGLIQDAIEPFFSRVAAEVSRGYFLRDWHRGPHAQIHLETDVETFDTTVTAVCGEVIGGFLERRPSGDALDPLEHLQQHERLAQLERRSGPLLPWRPNNSIHFEARLRRTESDKAADLLDHFYVVTTPLAFAITRATGSDTDRIRNAFDLMIATAHSLARARPADGLMSFRSHAEAFLHSWPEGEGLQPAWNDYAQAHLVALTGEARAVIETLEADSHQRPFSKEWVLQCQAVAPRARELIASDGFLIPAADQSDPADAVAMISERWPSQFHRALFNDPHYVQEVRTSEWFAEFRFQLNCLYLHFTRMGVNPIERFFLCYLAAATIEGLYGITTPDRSGTAPDPLGSHRRAE